MAARYHIGVNNDYIGIYDSHVDKLYPPIKIPPLIYSTKSSKLFQQRINHGLAKPASQHNISIYTRQVFQKIFVDLKLKQKNIASIVFVLNEFDTHLNRLWISKHSLKNEIKNVYIIDWKTAMCMEMLKKGKCKVENGKAAAVILLFSKFYHFICLQPSENGHRWEIKFNETYANDFSPPGFEEIKKLAGNFDVEKFVVYHFTNEFGSSDILDIFSKSLNPATVKFVFREFKNSALDCLNGAIFKARIYGSGDEIAAKYNVAECFNSQLRINCDNQVFHKLDVFGKSLPINLEGKFECNKHICKQLSIEFNNHGLDSDWKVQQIYPYPPNRSEISYTLKIDINSVTTFSLDSPHKLEENDTHDYTFARFEPKLLQSTMEFFPEVEPPHYSPSKEIKVIGGRIRQRKTRQQRQYRPKRARRRQPTAAAASAVYVEENNKPKKVKPKKQGGEALNERKELKEVARRMRNWQNKKFLFE